MASLPFRSAVGPGHWLAADRRGRRAGYVGLAG